MILLIIIITCVVSFSAFTNGSIFEKYKFSPFKIKRNKEYIRWVSGGFLHADHIHLFFNMFTLYLAQDFLNYLFRPWEILVFYLLAIIVSGVPDYIKHRNHPYYAAIGASGAVSASLFCLLLFNPWGKIYLFFVIPLPFIVFAVLYLYYSYYMSKKNYDNIGHMAHLTGAVFGIIVTAIKYPDSILSFFHSLLRPPTLNHLLGL